MIDQIELRIGSIVFNHEGKISIISKVGGNTVLLTQPHFWQPDAEWGVHCNELQPIPLTPEILEKINAEIYNQSLWDKLQFGKERYYDVGELRLIYKNNKFYHALLGVDKEINFVHQLQNLFYALCGKELEIKI